MRMILTLGSFSGREDGRSAPRQCPIRATDIVLPFLVEVEEPHLAPDHWKYRNHLKILRHIRRSFDYKGSALQK